MAAAIARWTIVMDFSRRRTFVRAVGAAALARFARPSWARSQPRPTFTSFLAHYRSASASERPRLVRDFVRVSGGAPIIEPDGAVAFLYAGAAREVRVIGEFLRRGPASVAWDVRGEKMERAAAGSDLFYKTAMFEPDARLEYLFLVDDIPTVDALNPRSTQSGAAPLPPGAKVATVSELRMPQHRSAEAELDGPAVPRGALTIVDESWARPKVTIYTPPGYTRDKAYPVLYTADGSSWIDYLRLPAVLDHLVARRLMSPIIAVMIDPADDRSGWYGYNPAYLGYLERVVEFIDTHYATMRDPRYRAHAGTSAGGRASLYVALERPRLFQNVVLLSPSLAGPPSYFEPFFSGERRPDDNVRVWLSAGSYEGAINDDARVFEKLFRKNGLRVDASYTHEGHSFAAWRGQLPRVLPRLFPHPARP